MFLREYIFVLHKVQHSWIVPHMELTALKSDVDSLLAIFASTVPKNALCESRMLDALQRRSNRMKAAIRRFLKVLWRRFCPLQCLNAARWTSSFSCTTLSMESGSPRYCTARGAVTLRNPII
jgi:hypothetical protein